MNKIKKCSIAGVSFTMEIDAYETLSAYIESLKNNYKNDPDGDEIVADIEARIAELILSSQRADAIICKPLICNIIKQMGSAEEIDNESTDHEQPHEPEKSDTNGNPRMPRRLYRDMESGKLGGVCAGIANYFDKDVTLIRLLMFVPLILSAVSGPLGMIRWFEPTMYNIAIIELICYLVMWFTVPVASSARQKLEMRGEKITAQSIKENTVAQPDMRERSIVAKIVGMIGTILLIVLKFFALLLLIGLVVGGSILGVVALNALPMLGFEFYTGLALLSFFFVAILPIIMLIYLAIMFLLSHRPKGLIMLGLLLLWIVALTSMTISAIKSPIKFDNSINNAFKSVFNKNNVVLYDGFDESDVKNYIESKGDLANTGMSSISFKIDEFLISSNHKPEMLAIFLGKEKEVIAAKESLKMDSEKKTISFRTTKGTPVNVTFNKVDCPEEAIEKGKTSVSGHDAEYTFVVDGNLKVYCAIGPKAKEDSVDEEFLKEIFKVDNGGGITGAFFNLPSKAVMAVGRAATENSKSAMKAHEKALKQHEKQVDKAKEQIEEAKKELKEAQKQIEQAKRENGTEGVKHLKNHFSLGDERAISHYENDMHIILCGDNDVIESCEKSLSFTNDYLTFETPKGKKVKASKDGIKVNGKEHKPVAKAYTKVNNKIRTATYNFSIDGIKVHFQQGPDIDMTNVTNDLVKSIFGTASKVFDAAGNILDAAGNIISSGLAII